MKLFVLESGFKGERSRHTFESGDQANERTDIAWEVKVKDKALDSTSKTYIWPVSEDMAIRRPSGLCRVS